MINKIIKIEYTYDNAGNRKEVKITRGSYYLKNTTRTYKYNEMSDAQHNLSVELSNRDRWTSFFFSNLITAYPAWFTLMDGNICRAAGTLPHCKRFFKPGMKIIRRTDYPHMDKK